MLLHSGTFDRGVKIPGRKNLSSGKPVTVCPPPDKLYVCLAQHIGKIAQPLVKKGDYVKKVSLSGKPTASSARISIRAFPARCRRLQTL